MNIEEASIIFKNFNERMVKYEEMRESLHNAPSPEARLQRFQERSRVTFDFYLQNQNDLKQLFCWIRGELDTKPSDEDFDVLIDQTRLLYKSA